MGKLNLAAHLNKLIIELIQRYSRYAFGVPQAKGYLLYGGKGVYHVGYCAHHVYRIEYGDCLGGVGHANGDLVPFLYPHCLQCLCAGVYVRYGLLIGGRLAHEVVSDIVRVLFRHTFEGFLQRTHEVIQMCGALGIIAFKPGSLGGDAAFIDVAVCVCCVAHIKIQLPH